MTVTVVTAIYGGYDHLKTPPAQSIDVDWLCVTDDPNLTDGMWKIIHEPRSAELHPRLAAKLPKCTPWDIIDLDEGSEVIWMDASFAVKDEGSIERLIEATRQDYGGVWQFAHPDRSCIFDEALFSKDLPKYASQPIIRQAAHYESTGHPHGWGLWATGLIVYPRWTLHRHTGQRWLLEQLRWTNQDQVSQPYVWHRFGERPLTLPGHLIHNDFVTLHPHLDGT